MEDTLRVFGLSPLVTEEVDAVIDQFSPSTTQLGKNLIFDPRFYLFQCI